MIINRSKTAVTLSIILLAAVMHNASRTSAASRSGTLNRSARIEKRVGFDQNLGKPIDLNLRFTDSRGHILVLEQLINRSLPTLLVLAYYDCARLCSLVIDSLHSTLDQIPYRVGTDYQLVIVSIDPQEQPALAHKTKQAYGKRFRNLNDPDSIHFLTGNAQAIATLAENVGFRYKRIENSSEFAHPAGAVVINRNGIISRYLFGLQFPKRDVRFALVEASQGKIGSPIDKFLLYCYSYNPAQGGYSFLIYRALQIGGALIILFILILVGGLLRNERQTLSANSTGGEQ